MANSSNRRPKNQLNPRPVILQFPSGFPGLPQKIQCKEGMTLGQRFLLATFSACANRHGIVSLSRDDLVEKTGLSLSSVQAFIKQFLDMKPPLLIELEPGPRKHRRFSLPWFDGQPDQAPAPDSPSPSEAKSKLDVCGDVTDMTFATLSTFPSDLLTGTHEEPAKEGPKNGAGGSNLSGGPIDNLVTQIKAIETLTAPQLTYIFGVIDDKTVPSAEKRTLIFQFALYMADALKAKNYHQLCMKHLWQIHDGIRPASVVLDAFMVTERRVASETIGNGATYFNRVVENKFKEFEEAQTKEIKK